MYLFKMCSTALILKGEMMLPHLQSGIPEIFLPIPIQPSDFSWGLQCRGDTNMEPVQCMAKSSGSHLGSYLVPFVFLRVFSVMSNAYDPMDCGLPDLLSMEFTRQESESGLPPHSGPPDPGINPCLCPDSRILYHCTSWKAQFPLYLHDVHIKLCDNFTKESSLSI